MAKSAKRKTGDAVTSAGDRAPKSSARKVAITTDDIARRAYELYLARGGEHGHAVDDWIQADCELHIDSEC